MPNIGEANKETSKRLTAELMWKWPGTFVVDVGWQDFRSETLLVVYQPSFGRRNSLGHE